MLIDTLPRARRYARELCQERAAMRRLFYARYIYWRGANSARFAIYDAVIRYENSAILLMSHHTRYARYYARCRAAP